MAGFSGALKLTDLDDFITPSQVSPETSGRARNTWERAASSIKRAPCVNDLLRSAGVRETGRSGEKAGKGAKTH